MSPRIARVVLPIPVDRPFDYAVPDAIAEQVCPGKRLLVPFRNAEKIAYCIETPASSEFENLKFVLAVIDDEPLIDAEMLALAKWMARYYATSFGEALDAILPAAVKHPRRPRKMTYASLAARGADLEKKINALKRKPTKAQIAILDILNTKAEDGITEVYAPLLRELAGVGPSAIKSLLKNGLVKLESRKMIAEGFQLFYSAPSLGEDEIELSREQETALVEVDRAIKSEAFRVILLHGVTGSGKTEVYLRALRSVVDAGGQGIVLVPEIALTPQTVARFSSRFDEVVILHSAQTDRERRDAWRQAASGDAQVVVGPRSAVFAPVRNLGLIVVDEEHEGSFKQENVPRYHARDVAVMRAHLLGIPVILGSATPSLASLANAQAGKYNYVPMKNRVTRWSLPPVKILDLKREFREEKRFVLFAKPLLDALGDVLDRKEQAILLMNRRGFHTNITCGKCGFVMKCRYCDIALTFHRKSGKVVCHYCGDERDAPERCPECGLENIHYSGSGTERVVETLEKIFPSARTARMDSDTMKTRSDYEKTLLAFALGDVDVLVGTQMIAKGLDFPKVTLVGALAADAGLSIPDFRAAERTFQLLVQVAGRAGRGEVRGKVYFQARNPEHYAITSAAAHDYGEFAKRELRYRKMWKYPPFVRLARIVVRGPELEKVGGAASKIKLKLQENAGHGVEILGPAPCPIAQTKGSHRVHILIKAPDHNAIRKLLSSAKLSTSVRGVQRITIDVDPLTIL